VAADLRSSVYRAIELLKLTYFDKKQVGAITSRVTQDTDRVWGFLVDGMPFLVSNTLMIFGILGLLLHINWKLTLCIMAPIPVVIVISAVAWRRMSQLFHRVGQKWARFHTNLNESLTGIRVVKAFAKEDYENQKFIQRNHELRNAGVKADSTWYNTVGVMSFFTGSGAVINWMVGGTWFIAAGSRSAISGRFTPIWRWSTGRCSGSRR